jgi:hypothetical protein
VPPEYIDSSLVSPKFDVFSMGVLILQIMDGNLGRTRFTDMGHDKFIDFVRKIAMSGYVLRTILFFLRLSNLYTNLQVCKNWREKLQIKPGYSSDEIDWKQMKKCLDIALRCVEADRNSRPLIKDVVHELEELEDEIKKLSLSADQPDDLIARQVPSF